MAEEEGQAPLENPSEECERIRRWELLRMLHLGLPLDDAERLALAGVSWHELDRLLQLGCTVEHAVAIVE